MDEDIYTAGDGNFDGIIIMEESTNGTAQRNDYRANTSVLL